MGSPSLSLWQSAAGKLTQDETSLLTFEQSNIQASNYQSPLDLIESYMKTTHEAYETCVRKRWQIKVPGKQDKIVVRDLLGKITHWTEVFQNVGDQAISFDPGHAALPWAGARFLLQIATNDFKQFDFVVEGAAKITKITARYRLIECIYLHHPRPATELLEQAIIRLYTVILRYIVQAKRYFQQRTGIRILKSGLLAQDDFQDLLQTMDTEEKEADRCTDLIRAEMANETSVQLANLSLDIKNVSLLRDALDRMEQPIWQTVCRLEKVEDYLDNVQRREILDWISSQHYHDHHVAVQTKVLDGTCKWVIQLPEFSNWQNESQNSLLWLHGTQGSGKSCLTSSVINKIMKTSEGNDMHALAYFYCLRDSAEPQRAMPQSILACIARQLSRDPQTDSIAQPTMALYQKLHSQDGSKRAPNITELSGLIRELTELYDRSIIVIDALDECNPDTRYELVEALQSLTESASLVKVFVSSREEGDLRLSLDNHSELGITSLENSDDIRMFVEFETDRLIAKKQLLAYIRKKETKEELIKLIKEEVISKANGMFRWAEMQLQSLRGIRTEKDIRCELSRTPRDLTALYQDLYHRALETTQETDRIIFQHTLKWLLCAQEYRTHEEFFVAITAFTDMNPDDLDEDFILDLLSNFVVSSTTEEGYRYFRFAHLSVLEFLETMPEYSLESTHTFCAEVTLLTLICASGSSSSKGLIDKLGVTPLDIGPLSDTAEPEEGIHNYSLRFWYAHCAFSGERNRSVEGSNIRCLLHFFLLDDSSDTCLNLWANSLLNWSKGALWRYDKVVYLMRNSQSALDRAFLLACELGFDEIARLAFRQNMDEDTRGRGAMCALRNNHAAIAKFLVGQESGSTLRAHIFNGVASQFLASQFTLTEGSDLLRRFLEFAEPCEITEKVIVDARFLKAKTIGILLDHNRDLHITEETFERCVHSCDAIKAFASRKPDMRIFPETLITVIKHRPFETELVVKLVNKADLAGITSEVISEAAKSASDPEIEDQAIPVLHLLLQRLENVGLIASADWGACLNDSTGSTVKAFLAHGWPVTPTWLPVAAERGKVAAFPILFEAVGETGQITPELLEAAAKNHEADGKEILAFLISSSSQFISDDQWLSLISCSGHGETLQFVLDMKPGVSVPESALLRLVKTGRYGGILPVLLNDKRELEITNAVVGTALEFMLYGDDVLQLLGRYNLESVTERMLIGAVSNKLDGDRMTQALFDQEVPVEVPSTQVINAVLQNTGLGLKILSTLEARFGPFEFTDDNVLAAVSGGPEVIELVFSRPSIKCATRSMLLSAASKGGPYGMEVVLRLDDAVVTRETLIAAVGNEKFGRHMLQLIWDHNHEIEIGVDMFMAAAGRVVNSDLETEQIIAHGKISDMIRFLVERIDNSQLGQKVLDAVAGSLTPLPKGAEIVEALLQSNLPVQLTHNMAARMRELYDVSSLPEALKAHCDDEVQV